MAPEVAYSVYPNKSPEQVIWECLTKSENELKNNEFISAYNRLKKVKRLIHHINDEKESNLIKQKYQSISGALNLKLIEFISNAKKDV